MSHRALNPEQFDFAFHPSTHRSMGGVPFHTVEVWPKESSETSWAKTHPGERLRKDPYYELSAERESPSGSFTWHHKTGEITSVYTKPEHQRQGIATAMLHHARGVAAETRGVRPPRHSSDRTPSGEAWARSLGERLPARREDF